MAKPYFSRILSVVALVLCIILRCSLDISAQGFQAKKVTFTISGSVGLSGVAMKGLPGEPVTDEDGNYSATVEYGWGGTVTPTKEGYTFKPANLTYDKVTGNLDKQNYTSTLIQLTVSGTAGMEGVVMKGLPGNPITDAEGAYSATVNYGWSGTVMPTREGYTFKPDNRTYDQVTKNLTNQSYDGKLITFTISGATGVEGVTMNGLPGNPVTGVGGLYNAIVNYGWSGTVTPAKEGYTFDPPEQKYSDVTGGQFNQNYTATSLTFTISGTTGMEGVVMNDLPGNPVTDADGSYTTTVDYGWSGKVTPAREGYTFEPANRIYDKVTTNQGNQGYTAKLLTFTISGTTGMAGVVMNGLPGNPVTDVSGAYSATVNYGFSSSVTPMKEGYTFKPANRIYDPVAGDQINHNYTGTLITFTISGRTEVGGAVINGLPGNPVASADGIYSATVNYGFSGTVTPMKEGYTFEPANRQYTDVTGSQANQNYSASLITLAISGKATSDDIPLEGVSVSADRSGGSDTTDAKGNYEVMVNYGWSGTVALTKEGYTFKPANKIYEPVTKDQRNQDFAATLLTFTISDTITVGETPIEGVLVSADNGGDSDTTDAEGKYSVTVPYGWSGTITPTKEGFIFEPPSKTYTNVTMDITKDGEPREAPERKVLEPEVKSEGNSEGNSGDEPEANVDQFEIERRALEEEIAGLRGKVEELSRPNPDKARAPELPEKPAVEEVHEEQPLVTNVFSGTDLREALQDIASQVGVAIIPEETVAGTVTCELKAVPLNRALEIVLASTGYVVKKTPYYYLVCSPDPKGAAFSTVSETRLIKLNYIEAPAAVKLLSIGLRQYVEADAAAGTVCATAPPTLMARIVSDLKLVDRPPRHVLLDARIIVLEHTDLLNLGIEWGWPKVSAGIFSDSEHHGFEKDLKADWPWGIQIGYTPDAEFTNSLELTLNLLQKNGGATVVASPQVLAQDGKKAEIKVITEEYYFLTAPETALAWYTRAELEKIESGTMLNITPQIGENNDITLEVSIEVSDSIPQGKGDLPVVTRRVTNNTVRVKDGGTVAVAGLTQNRTNLERSRAPGLANVPVLGELFRNTKDEKSFWDVAVFVTARLIPETAGLIELREPPTDQAPIEPVEKEKFKTSIRESLSRLSR